MELLVFRLVGLALDEVYQAVEVGCRCLECEVGGEVGTLVSVVTLSL